MGGSSFIYRGTVTYPTCNDIVKVAVKAIRCNSTNDDPVYIKTLRRRLSQESAAWSTFSHKNIIPLLGLAQDPALSGIVPVMVSPWCNNGTVLHFVQKYPETQRIPLIKGVASGLHYMHCLDAVHGDIKSANILISDDFRPLLTDFGFSKILYRREFDADPEFTLQYAAPEILGLPVENEGAGGNGQERIVSTKETDVWAFGMVGAEVRFSLYASLGTTQALADVKRSLFSQIVGGQEVFARVPLLHLLPFVLKGGRPKKADFPNISGDADAVWSLLEMCWNHDPGLRPTMEDILRSLS
ncbi:kinase-like protein [Coprinellus micaceus]|uniref:Kinase-like protein n=1 Tax=Coprinellus micaceus TaxID=71717 RepID=A0A4Y7SPX9_COPMI|nr:kinase-like protein [Coprinellus micaceus]